MIVERNTFVNDDCMHIMKYMSDNCVDMTLTDIPFGVVNRHNGLRSNNMDKGAADIETFNAVDFIKQVYRITKSNIIVFCAKEQLSDIYKFFVASGRGTTRQIIWKKTNPPPTNGQYVYLSGIENAVWFHKSGGVFNAFCKNTVFEYSNVVKGRIHPTEKNHELLKELLIDNTNQGDLVFDPCAGSGSTLICSHELGRDFYGIEKNKEYYDKALDRMRSIGVIS